MQPTFRENKNSFVYQVFWLESRKLSLLQNKFGKKMWFLGSIQEKCRK